MSENEVQEKARALTEWGGTQCNVDRIAQLIRRMDEPPRPRGC